MTKQEALDGVEMAAIWLRRKAKALSHQAENYDAALERAFVGEKLDELVAMAKSVGTAKKALEEARTKAFSAGCYRNEIEDATRKGLK